MDFQLQSAIYKQSDEDNQKRFKDSYDPDKNYPHLRGQIAIRVDELQALAKYLKESASLKDLQPQKFGYYNKDTRETDVEEHLAVLLDVTGYQNKTKSGTPMASLKIEPSWKMKKMLEEQALQSTASVNDSAANLAKSTGGAVVQTQQEDIF
tara:strand:+ start:458 stop:913 length:456 start_codon:yes stop_codon:yes gene_type:complete